MDFTPLRDRDRGDRVRTFLLTSHDGFGLGHFRRNTVIARHLVERDPHVEVVIVSGVDAEPRWGAHPRIRTVRVPPLLKDAGGAYRNAGMSFEAAVGQRRSVFSELVRTLRPAVILVDRHPYGTGGELREGLELARRKGAATVLGLRDVLDEPGAVQAELAGAGWDGVDENFDEIFVYGHPSVCDHEREYGLPLEPRYCGYIGAASLGEAVAQHIDPHHLVVSAGGGGDGAAVLGLGVDLVRQRPDWRATLIAGPYGDARDLAGRVDGLGLAERVTVLAETADCPELAAGAGAVLQMAGYNSTVEALEVGLRALLVPRRAPRREQAIRAARFAHLGLADMVDVGAAVDEVAWLLDRPRRLAPGALTRADIRLDGGRTAAERLLELARVTTG